MRRGRRCSTRPARSPSRASATSSPAAPTSKAELWTGLRPITPDGTPIVGATGYPERFLNTGHGTLGWTMTCGSGRLVADLVTRHQPAIRFNDLALARYGKVMASRRPGFDLSPAA